MGHQTQILGLSGKKQSGKTTTTNFILGCYLTYLQLITEQQYDSENNLIKYSGGFSITEKGELWISNLFGDTQYQGIFDYYRQSEALDKFKTEHLDPYIQIYSFADILKKEVCMNILGLTYEQCFGTDDDKNSLTDLWWENMPGVITSYSDFWEENNVCDGDYGIIYHDPGQMTAREVMQYVGTDIFRKMYGNVWIDATIRRIKKDNPIIAIITDVRFPNEVDCITKEDGHVLRFTRAPFAEQDEHESEKVLDQDRFDWTKFYKILENSNVSIKEHCQLVYAALAPLGLIPDMYADILKEENR